MATSKVLKPRRGSTAEHATFRGQAFEITFDTDKKTLVMHDGLTMGGFPLAHETAVAETDSALRTLIDQKVAEVEGVSSSELQALDRALRDLINTQAQQQAAKDADQDNVVTVLDSTLRALIAKYLPLAGGTMTGPIMSTGGASHGTIQGATNDSQVRICGGPAVWNLGGVGLWYGINSDALPGGWSQVSINPDGSGGSAALRGYYDSELARHVLKWKGVPLVISVNGVSADAAGNVSDVAAESHDYIRFSNGMQFCWGTVTIPAGEVGKTVTFPASFTGAPIVTTAVNDGVNDSFSTIAWMTPTTVQILRRRYYDGAVNYECNCVWFAVGRWK